MYGRLITGTLLTVSAMAAMADSGNPLPADDNQWRVTVAFPMVWAPDIDGKIRGGRDVDFTIGFSDILSNLDAGIMGELYANKGPFGLAFRVSYLNTVDESSSGGDLLVTNITTDMRMGLADLSASWKVHEKVRLLTGVRYVGAKLDVNIRSMLGDNEIINETVPVTDEAKYDFLIGINLDHWFTDQWGIMFNADAGFAGDNDRNTNLEFRALYRISDLNNFWFGYRRLNIGNDSTTDGTEYRVDMTQHGPTVGWAFTF